MDRTVIRKVRAHRDLPKKFSCTLRGCQICFLNDNQLKRVIKKAVDFDILLCMK